MKMHRVWAITLRNLYHFRHSYDRWSDAFYWPTIDLLLWGLTSSFLMTFAQDTPMIVTIIISGLLLWIIAWRAQYEITVNILQELWDRNLVNLFGSPLKFWEWIFSLMLVGLIKGVISVGFASLLAFMLYKVNLFLYGFYLIPFVGLLYLTGWTVGFIVSGIILRYGTKVQALAWTAIYIIAPFSAIYYPVTVLPPWAQSIAWILPTTYIFEGSREVINTGHLNLNYILTGFIFSICYLTFSIFLLRLSFKRILQKGLINVY